MLRAQGLGFSLGFRVSGFRPARKPRNLKTLSAQAPKALHCAASRGHLGAALVLVGSDAFTAREGLDGLWFRVRGVSKGCRALLGFRGSEV